MQIVETGFLGFDFAANEKEIETLKQHVRQVFEAGDFSSIDKVVAAVAEARRRTRKGIDLVSMHMVPQTADERVKTGRTVTYLTGRVAELGELLSTLRSKQKTPEV